MTKDQRRYFEFCVNTAQTYGHIAAMLATIWRKPACVRHAAWAVAHDRKLNELLAS